jgi:hypothetical protein
MEKTLNALNTLFEFPEVLEDDELRQAISLVIMRISLIIAKRSKKIERSTSPCPCGTCESLGSE